MTTEGTSGGPSLDEMIQLLRDAFPDAVVAQIKTAAFFSLDEKHWPNFATIVWGDDHDLGNPSDLARPGVFRVNVSVDGPTFERLVGSQTDPDYAAMDRFMPHPVYANQRWISIINPSDRTTRDVLLPLIATAHDRFVTQRRGAADDTQTRR